MDRRTMLGAAGLGSAGLAVPLLLPATPAAAHDPGGGRQATAMRFMAQSDGGVDADGVHHRIAMGGEGLIRGRGAVAYGSYVHFNNDEAIPVPKPVLSTGTWRSRKLRGFTPDDGWGIFLAGTVELDIELLPESGGRVPASFLLNCNLPPAGIFTPNGLPEGFFLDLGDLHFQPFDLGLTILIRGSDR